MISLYPKKKGYIYISAAFLLLAILHALDVLVGGMRVPIMDYWKWIAIYGEQVLDGTVTLADWFRSDAGQHIQPLCMMINFGVLKLFRFDVLPLVVGGMILRVLMAGGLMVLFVRRFPKEKISVVFGICAASVGLSVLNLCQWEILLEPFSLASACRVTLFYLSFLLTERFVGKLEERSTAKNLLYGACLGAYCCFLTLFVSAAYFVGHLVAIGLAILWGLWCKRRALVRFLAPAFLWFVLSLAGAVVYYILFRARAEAAVPTGVLQQIFSILQGIVCFWGSMAVHQTVSDFLGLGIVTAVGLLLLAFTVWVTFYYIRLHKDGKNLFPLICVLYAFLTGAVIAVGRVGSYGVATMTSSRYVVESAIGLVGLIFMAYDVLTQTDFSLQVKRLFCGVMVFSLVWLSASTVMELCTMPSRRAYSECLREKMLIIDALDDDALGEFQANSPDDVRYCVEFFKENGLSIFKDR
ncbi:MAG: hypothetical protein E7657_01065 [Ruminococcaceae bacterium]|nr:hypothetical protein [Oscillospiraceae bacterium]